MDIILYALAFLIGALAHRLLFKVAPGPFESLIWDGLRMGKRVIVSMDDEAFIFELNGTKLRITKGTVDFMEGVENEHVSSNLVDFRPREPSSTDSGVDPNLPGD